MSTTRCINFYRCPECGAMWQDIWDCECNDMCLKCKIKEIVPYYSQWFDDDDLPDSIKFHLDDYVNRLINLTDLHGLLYTDVFDDLVYDIMSSNASAINNEGTRSQIDYILKSLGPDGVVEIVKTLDAHQIPDQENEKVNR